MIIIKLDMTLCLTITLIILIILYIIILINKHSPNIIENHDIIQDLNLNNEDINITNKTISKINNWISNYKRDDPKNGSKNTDEYITFNDIININYKDMENIDIRFLDNNKNNTIIEELKKLRNNFSQIPFNENLNNIKNIISEENKKRKEDQKITNFSILYSDLNGKDLIAILSLGKGNIKNNNLTPTSRLIKTDNSITINRGRENLKYVTFINKNNYIEPNDTKYKSTTTSGKKCLSWVDSNPSKDVLENTSHGIWKKIEESGEDVSPIIYTSNICGDPNNSGYNSCYIDTDNSNKNRFEKC